MVLSCVVANCPSKKGDVTFHKLPKSNIRRNRWLKSVGIEDKDARSFFICSLHFKETDYFPVPKGKKKSILKLNALPSVLLWTEQRAVKKIAAKTLLDQTIHKNRNLDISTNLMDQNKSSEQLQHNSTRIAVSSESESTTSDSSNEALPMKHYECVLKNSKTHAAESSDTDSTTSDDSNHENGLNQNGNSNRKSLTNNNPSKRLSCEPTGDILLDMALTPSLGWSIERRINEVVFSKIRNNYVVMSCTFDKNMLYKINVLNREAPSFLIDDLMNIALEETLDITTLIKKLDTWNVCEGNMDALFLENFFYKELQSEGRLCHKTESVYSLNCILVSKEQLCYPCAQYRLNFLNSFTGVSNIQSETTENHN